MHRATGVLGGTFDPVHLGHLRMAQEVADALALTNVRFVPGGTPSHRAIPQAAAADRVAMVKLAIAGNPLFTLDDRETRRSGPSYSFDTLTELRAELGPARPLVMIMGADAFLGLSRWHRWRDLFGLAHIAVAHRPGAALAVIKQADLADEFAQRHTTDTQAVQYAPAGSIVVVPITALDISATAIRAMLRAGRSVRYLVPAAAMARIEHNYLFLKEIK